MININRITIFVLSLIPAYFALQRLDDVQAIVVAQAKFIASFFFVPVVIGLNWKRGTAAGAIAAMLGGFAACLVSEVWLRATLTAAGLDPVEIGVGVSLVLFVVVSLLTKQQNPDLVKRFFSKVKPPKPEG